MCKHPGGGCTYSGDCLRVALHLRHGDLGEEEGSFSPDAEQGPACPPSAQLPPHSTEPLPRSPARTC